MDRRKKEEINESFQDMYMCSTGGKTEEEPCGMEKQLEELTENMFLGVAKCRLDGKIEFVSKSFLQIMGLKTEDCNNIFKKNCFISDFISREDRESFLKIFDRLNQGTDKTISCECRLHAKNEEISWISFDAKILHENGEPVVYCFITDITKSKSAEAASKKAAAIQKKAYERVVQKNHQMQVILDAVQGGLKISRNDEEYTYLYVSDELCKMFGYTKEEYLKMTKGTAMGAVYPPDLKRVIQECKKAFQNGKTNYVIKYRIPCKDGSLKWIIDSGRKTRDESGNEIINSIYMDVADIEEANFKISEQRELLNSIYNSVRCGILRYRLEGNNFQLITLNQEAPRILGMQSSGAFERLNAEGSIPGMMPEDRDMLKKQISRLKEKGGQFTYEYCIQKKNEKALWVYGTAELFCDSDGTVVLQHVIIDITEKKKLELELEEERKRFRIAIESAAAVIFEYDIHSDTYNAYGTLEKSTKKHSMEYRIPCFAAKELKNMVEESFQESFYQFIQGNAENEMQLQMSVYFGSKEMVWAKAVITPVYGKHNEIIKVIGKISNIQSEKEKEFALIEAQTRDGLTGLYKKEIGISKIKSCLEERPQEQDCTLMILDMDDFKTLNVEEGTVFADAILQEVAEILKAETKEEDIQVRLGGDEFMLLIKDCGKDRAVVVGGRIAEHVKKLFQKRNKNIAVSVSIGMCATCVAEEYSALYRCAESTLKYVKKHQKGEAACYLDTSNELGEMLTQIYKEKHFINKIDQSAGYKERDLISFALELLGKTKNLDDAVHLLLARIGNYFDMDRVSVLECNEEYLNYRFTHQWARDERDLEADISFYVSRQEFDKAANMYDEEGLCDFNINGKVSKFPSCLHTGMWNYGRYTGSLSIETKEKNYEWTKEQRSMIKELGRIIFSFTMKAKADALSQAKTDFLSRMSHEIRTPMNAITGMAEIAKNVLNSKEKTMECLNKIEISSQYLLDLINDILDMSRIESGKMELNYEACDLKEQIDNIRTIMQPQAEEKNICFHLQCNYKSDRKVMTDCLRLKQVLVNIIGNAVKFTKPSGKIIVSMEETGRSIDDVTIRFSVKDTGIGIRKDELGKIFNAFEQAGKQTSSQYGGTGLGLSISSHLVQMMGGTLEVDSEPGIGSEFYFTLKFTMGEKIEAETGRQNKEKGSYTGKRILLVEDNDLNREIAKTILEMHGFIVECAVDGQDALENFTEHAEQYYDAVLMDIRMPVMDGLEATRRIRLSGRTDSRSVPVIAMTANAFDEDTKKSIDSGMNGHLSKPIEIDKLLAMLEKCLDVPVRTS